LLIFFAAVLLSVSVPIVLEHRRERSRSVLVGLRRAARELLDHLALLMVALLVLAGTIYALVLLFRLVRYLVRVIF
jgi:hypothetical protein